MTIKDYKKHIEDNSEKVTESGCWIWMKAVHPDGYGSITFKSKSEKAHRISYSVFNGEIEEGKQIMHSCDNPSCVNPAHLSQGTAHDNMQDMVKKGRKRGGNFKLGKQEVEFIQGFPKGFGSGSYLSALFGISQTQVSDIRRGKSWK